MTPTATHLGNHRRHPHRLCGSRPATCSRLLTETRGGVAANYVYGPMGAEMAGNATSGFATLSTDLMGSVTAYTTASGATTRTWTYAPTVSAAPGRQRGRHSSHGIGLHRRTTDR